MRLGSPVALADRLGQLADLLRQPGDRRRSTSGGVALAVRLGDQLLEGVEVHRRRSVPVGSDGKAAAPGLTYGAIPAMRAGAGGREGRPGWRLACAWRTRSHEAPTTTVSSSSEAKTSGAPTASGRQVSGPSGSPTVRVTAHSTSTAAFAPAPIASSSRSARRITSTAHTAWRAEATRKNTPNAVASWKWAGPTAA